MSIYFLNNRQRLDADGRSMIGVNSYNFIGLNSYNFIGLSEGRAMIPAVENPEKRLHIKKRTPPGTTPGILSPDPHAHKTSLSITAYNSEEIVMYDNVGPKKIEELLGKWTVIWVNVIGLATVEIIASIGKIFSLHPLALEDVVNVYQRPKIDDYTSNQFVVDRLISVTPQIKLEQVSFFLGDGYVISFLESPTDNFKMLKSRMQNANSRIRQSGADYLAYEILDTLVDCYFPALESYGDVLDKIERETVLKPTPRSIAKIYELKRIFSLLKRDIWWQRETLSILCRMKAPYIKDETTIYFRDCYDHSVQIIEILETYRDRSSSLTDIYLSSMTHRMNEIMKVLTVIATIFMPLSFLSSLWGMNFNTTVSPWNMPELRWYYGYPFALLLMLCSVLFFTYFFWRKGWIDLHFFKKKKRKSKIELGKH